MFPWLRRRPARPAPRYPHVGDVLAVALAPGAHWAGIVTAVEHPRLRPLSADPWPRVKLTLFPPDAPPQPTADWCACCRYHGPPCYYLASPP